MRILLTCPSLKDQGGVAFYYNSVLPHIDPAVAKISVFEIGSTHASVPLIHPVVDQLRFIFRIVTQRPDLVHINPSFNPKSFFREGLFILAAKLLRVPVLVFFRGWHKSFEKTVEKKLRWFFRLTYPRANACIVLSPKFMEWLRGMGMKCRFFTETTVFNDSLLEGFDPVEKYSGAGLARFKRLCSRAETAKLLFLASVQEEKGIFDVLEALSIVRSRGLRVTLTIAGTGRYFDQVKRWISGHDLAEAAVLRGYVSGTEKKKILETHDIFCLPSHDGEGMPNALMEAMAFGMPAIMTPISAIPDFFVHGEMGYLVPVRNPVALAEAIETLVMDPQAMRRMSARNHEYALARSSASKAAARLAEIYSSLMYSAKTQA